MHTPDHQGMKKMEIYFTLLASKIPTKGMAWKVFDFLQLLIKPLKFIQQQCMVAL